MIFIDDVRRAGEAIQSEPRLARATRPNKGGGRVIHLVAAEGAKSTLHSNTAFRAAGQHCPLRPGLIPGGIFP